MNGFGSGKTILVIGHSLAAPENRQPFELMDPPPFLCAPSKWRSPGQRHLYSVSETDRLRTLNVTLKGTNSFFLYQGLNRLIQALKPDLVYLWEEPWSLAAWQMVRLQKRFGFRLVFFSAENRPKKLVFPFSRLVQSVFRLASSAVVPTDEVSRNLQGMGFKGPIRVIPLWIAQRPLVTWNPNQTLVYVGRFIPLKRLTLLLQALPLIQTVTLRLIGDGPEKNNLKSLAISLGVAARLEFTGQVANDQIPAALNGASLLVLLTDETPHQAEQFGKSVLDAVLCGLPVAVASSGHLKHWASAFDSVKVVDCSSPEALANDIHRCLQDPPSRDTLQKAREKAQQIYSPQPASLRFTELFTDTLR